MTELESKSRFAEWFKTSGDDLAEFKKELKESDALEFEAMATVLLFQKDHFCDNPNINNYKRLADDLEHVATLCREYADFMRQVKENS